MKKKKPKSQDNILNNREIKELKSKVLNFKEKLAIYSAIYIGMRGFEFIHINVNWLDDIKNPTIITIPESMKCNCQRCSEIEYWHTKKDKEGKIINKILAKPKGVWKPKSIEGSRVIALQPEIQKLFKEYFKNHKSMLEMFQSRFELYRTIKRVAKRTNIKKNVSTHHLRATNCALLNRMRTPLLDITKRLGWNSTEMALTYFKHDPESAKDVINENWKEDMI